VDISQIVDIGLVDRKQCGERLRSCIQGDNFGNAPSRVTSEHSPATKGTVSAHRTIEYCYRESKDIIAVIRIYGELLMLFPYYALSVSRYMIV